MLPHKNRLRSKKDFDRVYRGGKTLNTALFRIKTSPNNLSEPRVGIVIPNKIVKKAVERNRKKRQVRAAHKELISDIIGGYDVVVIGQQPVAEASYQEILSDLRDGYIKIHLFKQR